MAARFPELCDELPLMVRSVLTLPDQSEAGESTNFDATGFVDDDRISGPTERGRGITSREVLMAIHLGRTETRCVPRYDELVCGAAGRPAARRRFTVN